MGVVYKGNNQLGESASGYFTFTPVRPSPAAVVYIVPRLIALNRSIWHASSSYI